MSGEIVKLNKKIEELEKLLAEHEELGERLKNSEQWFKILFEEAPDGYFLSNTKGVFIDGNKAAEELIGYKKHELIGKNMIKMKLIPLSQVPKVTKRLSEHFLKKDTGPGEITIIKKDGEQIIVDIKGKAVKMQGQNLILGIVRDVTDRKKIEEELKEKNKELEKINSLAVGRELKMIELKKEIKELESKEQ